VTATDIGSGKTVVFVQNASGQIPAWSQDPFVRAQSVTMGAEHALASAALPILFPAISVGERFFCDGGLRQNTPLSPALRLGADKVLVIGLRHKPPANESVPEESMPFPGAAFLVGKILDAFLLDHIDYDLDRLRRFNALIEAVRATGSPEHAQRFDQVVTAMRGAPYRIVGEYMIRPSEDLGAIAGHVARTGRFQGLGRRRRHPAAAPAGDRARRRRGRFALIHPVRRLLRRRGGAPRVRGRAQPPRRAREVPRRRGHPRARVDPRRGDAAPT
jgi:NTE family protein